ncbi:MAG: hypothetical protein PVF57_02270 [Pseudomonadales bacterium]|jgi:hypothetical protein
MNHVTRSALGGSVFLAGICLAGVALADASADALASATPAEIQRAEEQDPMVCKRFKPTGSYIARRYCLRKSQWDLMREEGQRAAREAIALSSQFGYQLPP